MPPMSKFDYLKVVHAHHMVLSACGITCLVLDRPFDQMEQLARQNGLRVNEWHTHSNCRNIQAWALLFEGLADFTLMQVPNAFKLAMVSLGAFRNWCHLGVIR